MGTLAFLCVSAFVGEFVYCTVCLYMCACVFVNPRIYVRCTCLCVTDGVVHSQNPCVFLCVADGVPARPAEEWAKIEAEVCSP